MIEALAEAGAEEIRPGHIADNLRESGHPMLTWEIRGELARLEAALAACRITGTITNARFLLELARDKAFARGDVDTGLIERELTRLVSPKDVPPHAATLAALAVMAEERDRTAKRSSPRDPWQSLGAWRLWDTPLAFVHLQAGDTPLAFRIAQLSGNRYEVQTDEAMVSVDAFSKRGDRIEATIDGHTLRAHAFVTSSSVTIFIGDAEATVTRPDPLAARRDDGAGGDTIAAPMPGLVKLVSVAAGETVSRGQALIVMEAMKMEHTLTAPRDGTIAEVTAKAGDQVEVAAVLLDLSPPE